MGIAGFHHDVARYRDQQEQNMQLLADFRKFATRGNIVDLAIGVIIGAAFGSITKSLVDDVIMPPIGVLTAGVDFKEHYFALDRTKFEDLKKDIAKREVAPREPTKAEVESVNPTLAQVNDKGIAALRYGAFINSCIYFLIVAFAMFLVMKVVLKLQRKEPPPPKAELTTSEKLLSEIRDELKKGSSK